MNRHARPSPRATYQDVLDAPPNMVAEIASGRLHLHPRPALRHSSATFAMAGELYRPFQGGSGPGGWRFMVEPELHLGPEAHPDILVPDLAGWRLDRMPSLTDAAFVTLAPDWLCEILSPSTRRFDLGEKRALYATHGVAHLWLLDPDARTLEAFTLLAGKWVLDATFRDDEEVRAAPFEAVGLSLGALWG